MVVGDLGRVVLIQAVRAGPGGENRSVGLIETCVPGPVICCCTHGNFLYYSTESDLLRLDLSGESFAKDDQEKDGEASRGRESSLQSPVSLNVCRLVAFAEASSTGAGEQDQELEM